MIKKIFHKKKLLAMIIPEKKTFKRGVNFLTPNHLTLQLGFIKHKANTYIKPHTHKNYISHWLYDHLHCHFFLFEFH